MTRMLVAGVALTALLSAAPLEAKTLCTAIADAKTGKILLQQGDCAMRVTPASTFKIALAVMGYEAGFLKDAHTPALPYEPGYVDWGGKDWRQPTDPARWMQFSVVWYSQQIAKVLGEKRLHDFAVAFHYGNADFSGDAGKNNGLERAWIGSSLKISPLEQIAFLQKLVDRKLPVAAQTYARVEEIVEIKPAGDWTVHGKTGSAFPRRADGSFDKARTYGWYVGWAEKNGRRLVFARLNQDEEKIDRFAGLRARNALLEEWPALAKAALGAQ